MSVAQLIAEIIIVMIIVVIMQLGTQYTLLKFDFIQDNDYYATALCAGIAGGLTHIFCESSGLNQYYCTHGNACGKFL